ncbi:MAG: DUF6456 domain-containing protein [Pseudoprimorskyibacter sp.]|nr:DUF6456 domain-containing protein [Pseudoprimorskyibacter sp.]
MYVECKGKTAPKLPSWVPDGARHYLEHTEAGLSIRHLARRAGCHASTVLRQVRRIETLRDDPLVDAALRDLARRRHDQEQKETLNMTAMPKLPDGKTLSVEARRILRRLCEAGAVLAVSDGMDKSVVVRGEARTAVVDTAIAQALALKNWISCDAPGRVSRYRVTADGRAALGKMVADEENRARGFAEAQAGFDGPSAKPAVMPRSSRMRTDSPLQALSRRREKDGSLFLELPLVSAGERLREDFELSQIGVSVTQNWDTFLVGRTSNGGRSDSCPSGRGQEARARLEAALADLGPGLADVALRCCCYLEGLEVTEKQMGWSQRSGKIVLRIALQRLVRHYETCGRASDMIG